MFRGISPRSFVHRLLSWLMLRDGRLKERTLRGGVWVSLGTGVSRAVSALKLIILARLLGPTDFGLIGIGMLMITWIENLSQPGFRQALILTPGDIQPYLNTLWIVQVLRGLVLSTLLFLGAPFVAQFFNHPEVQPVIQALAPLMLLRGLTNPAVIYLTRELDFRRLVMWEMGQVMADLAVAIPLAFVYRNVWALVYSLLFGRLVATIFSYALHPFRPRFRFDWTKARTMAQFGKWFFWINILTSLTASLDSLIVGKLLGPSVLGLYQIAARMAHFPTLQVLGKVLPRVTFPAFAQLQQADQFRQAYAQVLQFAFLFVLPVVSLLFAFPQVIVHLFLGSKWVSIITVLQLLTISGGLNTVMIVVNPMVEGMGRADLSVKLRGTRLILSLLLLYPFTTTWGMVGAAAAIVLIDLLMVAIQCVCLRQLLDFKLLELIATARQGALVASPFLGMGLLGYLLSFPMGALVGLSGLAAIASIAMLWRFLFPYLNLLKSQGDWIIPQGNEGAPS